MTRNKKPGPLRSSLLGNSSLCDQVKNGLQAVEHKHLAYIDESIRPDFSDSLDLDKAMRAQFPQANRWDYLLGYKPDTSLVAMEPHSARQDQIRTVIDKKKGAIEQLRSHLKKRHRVQLWLWVASGKVDFLNTSKVKLRLAQEGIRFVGRKVKERDL